MWKTTEINGSNAKSSHPCEKIQDGALLLSIIFYTDIYSKAIPDWREMSSRPYKCTQPFWLTLRKSIRTLASNPSFSASSSSDRTNFALMKVSTDDAGTFTTEAVYTELTRSTQAQILKGWYISPCIFSKIIFAQFNFNLRKEKLENKVLHNTCELVWVSSLWWSSFKRCAVSLTINSAQIKLLSSL